MVRAALKPEPRPIQARPPEYFVDGGHCVGGNGGVTGEGVGDGGADADAVGVQRGDGHGGVGVTGEILGVYDAEHVKAGLFCGDGMLGDFVGSELSAPGDAEVHFHGRVLRWGGVLGGIIAYGGEGWLGGSFCGWWVLIDARTQA